MVRPILEYDFPEGLQLVNKRTPVKYSGAYQSKIIGANLNTPISEDLAQETKKRKL